MAHIKVRNGTPSGQQKNLCLSCIHGIVRKDDQGHTNIKCDMLGVYIRSNTIECSFYADRNKTSIRDLEKLAWHIMPGNRGAIGFKPYKDLSEEEKQEIRSDSVWKDY